MSFSTENRTVNDLFHRNVRYIIPRYQREYVWTDVNWNELLADVQFTIENDHNDWSHFLGTIVLNRLENKNSKMAGILPGIDDFEIIDGQQRLTTLYIIFICIAAEMRNYVPKDGEDSIVVETARNRAKTFESLFLISKTNLGESVPKLYNPDYAPSILELLQYINYPDTPIKKNAFYKLYHYIQEHFSAYSYEKLDQFLSKTLAINIVEIISDKDEEIYNIFEVLNARGQKLKQMELLKNHILKYVTPREDEYIDMARKKWVDILDNVSSLSNEDEFIDHFCKCYIKRTTTSAYTYRLIKEEVPIKAIGNFLDDLVLFSKHYRDVINRPNINDCIQYFHIKNNKQIRPLLTAILALVHQEIIEDQLAYKTIENLRNFFVIFNITKQTSNKLEDIVKGAAYTIYHVKYFKEFQIEISRLFYALQPFLPQSKVSFAESLFTNPSLKYSNKDTTLKRNGILIKYIFMELYKTQQRDTKMDSKDLTIEHLLNDNGDTESAKLQNLTLTSASINGQQLQDKPINEKLLLLETESSIQANKELKKYYAPHKDFFDSEARKEDILNLIYDNVFNFSPECFQVTVEDIKNYDHIHRKTQDHETLTEMLKRYGLGFEKVIENDPKCDEARRQYMSLG